MPAPFRSDTGRAVGFRLIVFLAAALIAIPAVGPVAGLVSGLVGIGPGHAASGWLFPVLVSSALLGVTWIALRWEGSGLRELGLVPTRKRTVEFGAGFAVAAVLFAAVA